MARSRQKKYDAIEVGTGKKRRFRLWSVGVCLLVVLGVVVAGPALVEYRLWEARAALRARNDALAVIWLDRAANVNPEHSQISLLRARICRRSGDLRQAGQHLRRALDLGHSAEAVRREELLVLAQLGRIDSRDSELAAMAVNPRGDDTEIYEALVRGSLELFQIDTAFSYLDAWIGDFPEDSQPHYLRGIVCAHQKAWSEAEHAFLEALKRSPERWDVRREMAHALRKQYRFREAIQQYQLGLQHEEEADTLYGLGMCHYVAGQRREAREILERLLAIDPEHYGGLLTLGKLDALEGQFERSLRWLVPAAQQKPHESEVRLALAWSLLCTGKKQAAREHFEYAAKSQAATIRAANLMRQVDQDPQNSDLRYEVGVTLLEFGQPQDAAFWLRSALACQPDHELARKALDELE